jgi:hypothetical protein
MSAFHAHMSWRSVSILPPRTIKAFWKWNTLHLHINKSLKRIQSSSVYSFHRLRQGFWEELSLYKHLQNCIKYPSGQISESMSAIWSWRMWSVPYTIQYLSTNYWSNENRLQKMEFNQHFRQYHLQVIKE